jgi:TonB family protein
MWRIADDAEAPMCFPDLAQAPRFVQVALVCAAAIASAPGLGAQTQSALSGVVTDAANTPVFGAIVEVTGTQLRARTNERGEFRLAGIAPGVVDIQFRRLGFSPVTRSARFNPNESTAPLHIVLPALPTMVKPVIVQATRVEYTGRLAGYYERLSKRTSGNFIPREEIDRRSNRNLSSLIASMPGVNETRLRMGGSVRMRGRNCRPLVWLDGTPLPAGEVDLDAFPVNTLHGIELYLGSSNAPATYTLSRGQSSCGTILLWSRGRDTEPRNAPPRRRVDLEELAAERDLYTSDQVDTQAAPTDQSLQVHYPPALFASGVTGTVIAEFIVEADGAIDPASFEIFSSSNTLFAEAVMQALSKAKYTPALKNGVAVRQLVQQPFNFSRGAVRTSASNQH